ncbi:MAG: class II D-tagatose-bisphosphate aldolase, non-catalytic subunit [Chloroflexi bacterium]|nr:class II D-tagatose-bisphosphate aldolase, non-catalytic subunit [Chloroflexota bacterium]MCL5274763.1 class II D-tagatose-bisphosphate aldolase, non-catalytic subunit [Chloroflexota bacterium]
MNTEPRATARTIRAAVTANGLPPVEAMIDAIRRRFKRSGEWVTLLAVCPNSEAVLKAALEAARDGRAPMLFAATLNQVDLDAGYTGWRQRDFVDLVRSYSREIGFAGTAVCCLDHGGPWLKDRQRSEGYSYEAAMDGVKASLVACIDAGYELLHVDPTVDVRLGPGEIIDIHDVARRTLELIDHAERHRRARGLPRISYEVGTEEVHGGLANMDNFRTLLDELKAGLLRLGYANVWPIFVVGKVGTDLHTSEFDAGVARTLAEAAAPYGSVIKGHYSDNVSNPEAYPLAHMGGANVGPEFTEIEYETLSALEQQEGALLAAGAAPSRIGAVLEQAVERSGRWTKWLLPDEAGRTFAEIDPQRRAWLTRTGCRYIWTDPQVLAARRTLYANLAARGIDGERAVIDAIAQRIAGYFRAFNLLGADEFLAQELA